MGEGNLAGLELGAATKDGSGAGGVMWGAEGALSKIVVRLGGEGMELSDFNLFWGRGWRQKRSCGPGEEGFAGAGWAGEKKVVVASDGDGEGAFSGGLPGDVVEENGRGGRGCGLGWGADLDFAWGVAWRIVRSADRGVC